MPPLWRVTGHFSPLFACAQVVAGLHVSAWWCKDHSSCSPLDTTIASTRIHNPIANLQILPTLTISHIIILWLDWLAIKGGMGSSLFVLSSDRMSLWSTLLTSRRWCCSLWMLSVRRSLNRSIHLLTVGVGFTILLQADRIRIWILYILVIKNWDAYWNSVCLYPCFFLDRCAGVQNCISM